jgi:Reverse transcriptase (RNA-dependent DNA polymerase)
MDKVLRSDYATCTIGSIAEHIERNRRGESGYRNPMEGNDRWALRRWKTKSYSTRWGQCSTRSGKRTFWAFRTDSSQHDALDALYVGIMRKKVNWVLDLDVRSFFDKVDHKWLVKFVEHRIGDRRIVRLIRKWLILAIRARRHASPARSGGREMPERIVSGAQRQMAFAYA